MCRQASRCHERAEDCRPSDGCGDAEAALDYNETIGLGCDGAESQGEGLRRQIQGVYSFFERIRERLPDLVIENCSSGGHRLEPAMIGRTAMSSFSDAHELREIPIIAANLHSLMLPRQSQIWAVLHPSDSDQRLAFSLAATFLGRMCLSGDVDGLSGTQWDLVRQALDFYRQAAPIIRDGASRRCGRTGPSWRHPEGWQGVVRVGADGGAVLIVLHAFALPPAQTLVPLPPGGPWRVAGQFPSGEGAVTMGAQGLGWPVPGERTAQVVLLERTEA